MASHTAAYRFLQRLAEAADSVRAGLLRVYVGFGLSSSGFDLLSVVAARGDAGCSQTEIATELRVAESSVCTLVDRLQAEGLLHRFRSKQDRRRSLVLLTSVGRARLAESTASAEAALRRWLEDASDAELELLAQRMQRLVSAIDGESSAAEVTATRLREAG